MEEIITVNGQQYQIDTIVPLTQEQRNEVISQLNGNISTLASCSNVNVGAIKTLTATAATGGISPYTYNWLITKPDLATDTRTGQTATYQFSLLGTYTVQLTVTDSCSPPIPYTESCTFQSQPKAVNIFGCSVKCVGAVCDLKYTETCQFTVGCKADNDDNIPCPTITWNSSDQTIASINSSSGLVTAQSKTGSATITASGGGITSNVITVNVSPVACIKPVCSFSII